jgi:putative membrane protein
MANTNSLDTHPGMAPTGSADKSATKEPNAVKDAKSGPSSSDKMFVKNASQGGMLEVELGKVAQDKGSSSDVKEFGSHMVTDHSAANDKLMAIAKEKGLTVSDSLDAKHQAIVDKLSKLSGAEFDKAYVAEMVKDHKHDAMAFQKESDNTSDPELKSFASDTLVTVKSHLGMIEKIQSGMK